MRTPQPVHKMNMMIKNGKYTNVANDTLARLLDELKTTV